MGDKASGWRLLVNPDLCQGHNRCYLLLPDLIELDDHGFASVKDGGMVPQSMLEKAKLAVRNCPEFALRLEPASREREETVP
jgi:ferredoxin